MYMIQLIVELSVAVVVKWKTDYACCATPHLKAKQINVKAARM